MTCLMYAMEDEQVSLASLGLNILNNQGNKLEVVTNQPNPVQVDFMDMILNIADSGQLDFGK